jgi:LysM repeat protein
VKVPGIGEVKTPYVIGGVSVLVGVLGYAYYKNGKQKKAAAAAAATTAATSDQTGAGSSGIDPSTGVPYSQETGSYGSTYGGIDPATGIPYYDEITQSSTTGSTNTITTNAAWIQQAESDAQNLFGYTSAVATSGVGKYISQTNAGLQPNEYLMMQSVVADLGQPPTGGPYRLIQAPGTSSTTTTNKSLAGGEGIIVPYVIQGNATMASVAAKFGIGLQHLINSNPGSSAATKGGINIPYTTQNGDTLSSLANKFGVATEHMQQILSSQGITA